MESAAQATAVLDRFRCLDDGHEFTQAHSARGPLVTRQTTWCAEHDAPAVRLSEATPASEDA